MKNRRQKDQTELEGKWKAQLDRKEQLNQKHTNLPAISAKRKMIAGDVDVKLWVYADDDKEPERDNKARIKQKFDENFEYLG